MFQILKKLWFPLCLLGLVLLALPGALLIGLNQADLSGPVNQWLENRFSLTYHPAVPGWATIALLFVPIIIALLYFLKLKRKPIQVPSTFLWRKSIEDLHVNSLFQWLRDNVLLLVQLCIILLLIYSGLQFQIQGEMAVAGHHYVILIDNSASMSTRDVSP